MTVEEKFQRACALLQLIINAQIEDQFDIEDEVRQQLRDWGIKVPDRIDEI